MLKNKKISQYKEQINKLIVDGEIKNEILNIIDLFVNNGKIKFDDNNLYGKIIHQNETRSIVIRYNNSNFIFNYIDSNEIFKKNINITQEYIKGGNHKINRQEKIDYRCVNNRNRVSIEEIEKIYNIKNHLVYDSTLKKEQDYNTHEDHMDYNNGDCCENSFYLEKKWYIPNGSAIKYTLSKDFVNEQSNLYENHSICKKPYYDDEQFIWVYEFVNLDENLFKSFMIGEINIDEVLKQIENNKIFQKNLNNK